MYRKFEGYVAIESDKKYLLWKKGRKSHRDMFAVYVLRIPTKRLSRWKCLDVSLHPYMSMWASSKISGELYKSPMYVLE